MSKWIDVELGTPTNGKRVVAEWHDNTWDQTYVGYVTWDRDNRGWNIDGMNSGDFTIRKWLKDD